jgi:phosphonate transport system permease protein
MTALATHDVSLRPERPIGPRLIRVAAFVLIVIPVLWGAAGLNLSWSRILSAPGDMWGVIDRMIPPDMSPQAVQRAMPKIGESLWIAWIGTMIGAAFSFPMAFLAARNTSPGSVNIAARQVLNGIRAVPELLVAIILIPVTGLGALTGTLALGIHSIGTLGKLSSEVVEGIDPGPVEAVAAAGGGPVAQVRFGVIPQVMPTIVAYWLYRFEINIRASAVLGVVGAGGIGAELVAQIRFNDLARAGTVLFLTVAAVLAIDAVSARIRRRIITGERGKGPVATFSEASWLQRVLTTAAAAAGVALVVFLLVQLQADV